MKTAPAVLNSSSPPAHVAIIMDGNGRWAKARGIPRIEGHWRGAEAVHASVRFCIDNKIKYLTLYGFSSENWRRPEAEVSDLMGLLRFFLRSKVASLHEKEVRFQVIGQRGRLPKDVVLLITEAEKLTAANHRLCLTIALSYGGRAEIVRAARTLAEDAAQGRIDPEAINEKAFSQRLYTASIPDPDILIRTSGEKRISNFLLWQLAYAEFIFLDTLWPDFSEDDFRTALGEFHQRERRYGAIHG